MLKKNCLHYLFKYMSRNREVSRLVMLAQVPVLLTREHANMNKHIHWLISKQRQPDMVYISVM